MRVGVRGVLLPVVSLGAAVALSTGAAGCGGGGAGSGGSALVAATIAPTGRSGIGGRVAAATTTGTSTSSTTAATTRTTTTTTSTTSTGPTVVPIGPCLTLYGPGRTPPIEVATTSKAVTMSWWHNGDPAAIAYWVGVQPGGFVPVNSTATSSTGTSTATTAASGTTPTGGTTAATTTGSSGGTSLVEKPITWTKVTPPAGCRVVTFTVPGVVAGVNYSLWLEFEARTPELTPDHARVVLGRVGGVRLR